MKYIMDIIIASCPQLNADLPLLVQDGVINSYPKMCTKQTWSKNHLHDVSLYNVCNPYSKYE